MLGGRQHGKTDCFTNVHITGRMAHREKETSTSTAVRQFIWLVHVALVKLCLRSGSTLPQSILGAVTGPTTKGQSGQRNKTAALFHDASRYRTAHSFKCHLSASGYLRGSPVATVVCIDYRLLRQEQVSFGIRAGILMRRSPELKRWIVWRDTSCVATVLFLAFASGTARDTSN